MSTGMKLKKSKVIATAGLPDGFFSNPNPKLWVV
jgi:hypothetical protein